jgi:hypothetical protein
VREHYHDVLLGSLAWFIGNVGKADVFQQPPKGLDIPMAGGLFGGSTVVASVRYTGSIHLKVEAFTAGEEQAKNISSNLQVLMSIVTAGQPVTTDPDVKTLFESIQVETKKERVLLTATLPEGFIRKVLTEPPTEPMAAPAPAPTAPKKKRK